MTDQIAVKDLGLTHYEDVWRAMREFTQARNAATADEIWLTEHHPVFTQGQSGKAEHLLFPGDIPVVHTDRGGQVTYHGPGQIVAYPLIHLQRRGISVRGFVSALETSMVRTLADEGIKAHARPDAPGVYVGANKIGSVGVRVRKGCTYHGLSLNVVMDLEPFARINPCGLVGMQMTQIKDLVAADPPMNVVKANLLKHLRCLFGVNAG